jgi:GNAT superfamily N-acetyltransferase
MRPVTFAVVAAGSVEARWAMARYFEELDARIPGGFDPGDAMVDAAAGYDPPDGAFVVARAGEATVGCGAVVFLDDETAEVKRMWISSEVRGRGLGKRLLAHLEDEARRGGRSTVLLDTNGALTEAIAMYEAAGYRATTRYNDNPYAERWFSKHLP